MQHCCVLLIDADLPTDTAALRTLPVSCNACTGDHGALSAGLCAGGAQQATCGRPRFLARWLTLVGSALSMRPYSSQCSLSSAQA